MTEIMLSNRKFQRKTRNSYKQSILWPEDCPFTFAVLRLDYVFPLPVLSGHYETSYSILRAIPDKPFYKVTFQLPAYCTIFENKVTVRRH